MRRREIVKRRCDFWLTVLLMVVPAIGIGVYWIVRDIQWNRNVSGHIKRAADANNVDLALQEMAVVVDYLEKHGITEGYTSVFFTTPDEEIKFWYENLRDSLYELSKVSKSASQADREMVLLKLRQTLLDHTPSGEKVTEPPGIALYPHNAALAVASLISLLLFVGAGSLVIARIIKSTS